MKRTRLKTSLLLLATISGLLPGLSSAAGLPAARVTDATATGGVIVSGAGTVLIGNLPAARVTDQTTSPAVVGVVPCIGGTITTGSSTVLIEGLPAARMTSQVPLPCGLNDTVTGGEPTVLIGQ